MVRFGKQRLVSLIVVLAAVLGLPALVWGPTADAATSGSCSGYRTWSDTVTDFNGQPVGLLSVYYSPANGGTNSACFRHANRTVGVYYTTWVTIYLCAETSGNGSYGCSVVTSQTDSGYYKSFAGPVSVNGTAQYCVVVEGGIAMDHFYSRISPRVGCPN